MAALSYYSHGKYFQFNVLTPAGPMASAVHGATPEQVCSVQKALHANARRLDDLFATIHEAANVMLIWPRTPAVTMLATESLTVEGASKAELSVLKEKYGMRVVREGLFGKMLLRNDAMGGLDAVKNVFACAVAVYKRGSVKAAHPNFVRVIDQIDRSPIGAAATRAASPRSACWSHLNDGTIGVRGADVAVRAAWTIHRGDPAIRVAVLDEGVDDKHPDLRAAIVAQKDFAEGNPTAAPSGNDAHGTACAGIIVGRGHQFPGITACSLVAVRIAKGDGSGGWVFDDFATADAIDWSWNEAKADVLSNSWGGGLPVDVITNAFVRARTKGRGGKGSVLAIAAGNSYDLIYYPATQPEVLCVGASNEWDEWKCPKDGDEWGSCFGREMSIVAPGVNIATTDIAGAAGYTSGNHFLNFNGTSAATAHVAAAAALVLSVAPGLKEKTVRAILTAEAAKLTGAGKLDPKRKWNKEMGWGRLDIHAALRRALHR